MGLALNQFPLGRKLCICNLSTKLVYSVHFSMRLSLRLESLRKVTVSKFEKTVLFGGQNFTGLAQPLVNTYVDNKYRYIEFFLKKNEAELSNKHFSAAAGAKSWFSEGKVTTLYLQRYWLTNYQVFSQNNLHGFVLWPLVEVDLNLKSFAESLIQNGCDPIGSQPF